MTSTTRKALLASAGFWTIGAVMLAGSRFGAVGVDRFRNAPPCTPSQTFTSAYCRATVDATLTAITREQIVLDVDGRRVTADMKFHGPLPTAAPGLPMRVTIYRGVAVHLDGGALNLDTISAPTDRATELRIAGVVFLIVGTLPIIVVTATRSTRRPSSP